MGEIAGLDLWLQGGAVGILGMVFLSIVRGWLVPGNTVDRIQRQWEAEKAALIDQWRARLEESHKREQAWKEAHDVRVQQSNDATDQIRALVEAFETLEDFVRHFREVSRGGGP